MSRKKMSRIDLLGTKNWGVMLDNVAEYIWTNTIGKHDHVGIKMGEIIQSASFPGELTRFLLEFQVIPKIDRELMDFANGDIVGEIFRTIFRGIEHMATDVDLVVKQYQKRLEYERSKE